MTLYRFKTGKREDFRLSNYDIKGNFAILPSITISFDKKHDLKFHIPNFTAMYLDQSFKSWKVSKKFSIKEFFTSYMLFNYKRGKELVLQPKSEKYLFDIIQQRMIAIVFAYTSLESFANESIPTGHIFRRKNKKLTEEFNKEQIERLDLDTKLREVLPEIYNVESPIVGNKIWQAFTNIKTIRDRIIHLKTADKSTAHADDESIWKDLLNDNTPHYPKLAKEIIAYFINNSLLEKPRWFTKIPW